VSEQSTGQERRQYFRLFYPVELAPKLLVSGFVLPVLDLSEAGIRFRGNIMHPFVRLQEIKGILVFQGGDRFEIIGNVVRVHRNDYAIKLQRRLPYHKIMAEQQYLLKLLRQKETV
jgi:hypothetical protein